jgi:hypothetical protein
MAVWMIGGNQRVIQTIPANVRSVQNIGVLYLTMTSIRIAENVALEFVRNIGRR